MSKHGSQWYSERLQCTTRLVRWGHYGVPLLLFPTAAGDAEECERRGMIHCLAPWLEAGRIKVYSVDSIAGQSWLDQHSDAARRVWVQNQFDAYVYHEVVPAIAADCQTAESGVLTAGASIGAYNAIAAICRHPDAFVRAVGMSGTYDLTRWLDGKWFDEFYFCSPLHYLPEMNFGWQLELLRRRLIVLAFGKGRWENPGESWKLAHLLGSKGIPNRVDPWDESFDHDWPTWRAMLPQYVEELLQSLGGSRAARPV